MIDQSQSILMGTYGMDEGAAFNLLRRWSQTNNIKLVQISQALVANPDTPRRTAGRMVRPRRPQTCPTRRCEGSQGLSGS